MEHIFGRIDPFVPANAYPESVEVGGSERGYDTLDAIVTIGGSSESPSNDVELVVKRIVDDNQTPGSVRSLAKHLLDGGAGHVHQGFYGR